MTPISWGIIEASGVFSSSRAGTCISGGCGGTRIAATSTPAARTGTPLARAVLTASHCLEDTCRHSIEHLAGASMTGSETTESCSVLPIPSSMLTGASSGLAGTGTGAVGGGAVVVAAAAVVVQGGACWGAVGGDVVVVDGDKLVAAL